jgi:hypothetical protein
MEDRHACILEIKHEENLYLIVWRNNENQWQKKLQHEYVAYKVT